MDNYIKPGFWEGSNWLPANSLNINKIVRNELDLVVYNKKYTVFISQEGTSAPTINSLLKDDIENPVWEYSSVGTFTLTKTGKFITNKTVPGANKESYTDNVGNLMTMEWTSENVMTLKTYAAADTTVLANSVLVNQYINIEIYL